MDKAAKHAAGSLRGAAGSALPHESAVQHVSGEAVYVDDQMAPEGVLHAYVGLSTIAHGRITAMQLEAVRAAPGVVDVITRDEIPGHDDIGPVFPTVDGN